MYLKLSNGKSRFSIIGLRKKGHVCSLNPLWRTPERGFDMRISIWAIFWIILILSVFCWNFINLNDIQQNQTWRFARYSFCSNDLLLFRLLTISFFENFLALFNFLLTFFFVFLWFISLTASFFGFSFTVGLCKKI